MQVPIDRLSVWKKQKYQPVMFVKIQKRKPTRTLYIIAQNGWQAVALCTRLDVLNLDEPKIENGLSYQTDIRYEKYKVSLYKTAIPHAEENMELTLTQWDALPLHKLNRTIENRFLLKVKLSPSKEASDKD